MLVKARDAPDGCPAAAGRREQRDTGAGGKVPLQGVLLTLLSLDALDVALDGSLVLGTDFMVVPALRRVVSD